MANLDKQLSQEVKQHQLKEKWMKYIIIQLVNQKQELEEKLAKTTPTTKPLTPLKPATTKPPALSFPTLKKPISANPKSNVKYISITNLKEALILKSPSFIKFNQIQIEKIESENFSTPILRQGDIIQKEINEISNLEINTLSLRQSEMQITFLTLEPLPQTFFITSELLSHALSTDSLLI
jgi:hypothetical protein